jgi:hypothetical protein
MKSIKALLLLNLRVLTFRAKREDFDSFSKEHLLYGLCCTWLAGIGRWWDDPKAKVLQYLGLGSVVYIFILAAIIWLLVLPLRPRSWSYMQVLTFISFTSLPAFLYAIPVETFTSLEDATNINVVFLGIIASWRISLLFYYLIVHPCLHWFYTSVVTLLPITTIVVSLSAMNLHRVVFNIMGGLREIDKTPHDGEYGILFLLSILSFYSIGPLFISYVGLVTHAQIYRSRRNQTKEEVGISDKK